MAMKNHKKGVFFSFTSILILLVLFAIFSSTFTARTSTFLEESEHEQISIADSNTAFLKENYLEEMLRFSFRDAVSSYIEESAASEEFIVDCFEDSHCSEDSDDIDELVEMLKYHMATGHLTDDRDEFGDNIVYNLSESRNFISYLDTIKDIFEDDFLIKLTFLDSQGDPWPKDQKGRLSPDHEFISSEIMDNINVEQTLPFSVTISFSISFNVSVRDGSASWHHEDVSIEADVSLTGLPDPMYTLGTMRVFGHDMQFNNSIREDSRSSRNDSQSVVALYDEMRYVAAPGLAPSFFQRMVNSPNPSDCCGIESLVNINRMYGLDVNHSVMPDDWFRRSNVDYKYFYYNMPPGANVYNCREVAGQADEQLLNFPELSIDDAPAFFNLDMFYAENYNLDQLLGSQLCEFSDECQSDESCVPAEGNNT
ncbi:MAG: hypothetical protein ACLFTR_04275 [Candidatus Woesearchaeota archaeon]